MFCSHINVNDLEYKEPQSNRSGGKVVHVSTVPGSLEYKDRIRFQMSEDQTQNLQTAVWGLSTPLPGQDSSRRTLELTIESPDLLRFLERLDEHNINIAVKNSSAWFRKELDESAIRNMYVSLVKQPQKPDQKPTVRVKVKCGDYPSNLYVVHDESGQNISYKKGHPDDITRNVKCMVMTETVGLWFMSRQFGMSLTATEILLWPNRRTTGIDAFTFNTQVKLEKVCDDTSSTNQISEGMDMDP